MNEPRLLSFKASRRAIGLAVFTGLTLECTFVRELSSDGRKAVASTRQFVRWSIETFPSDSILVEKALTHPGSRGQELARIIRDEGRVVPGGGCIEAHPADVFAPHDRPWRIPRQELRLLARLLWPILLTRPSNPVALDAAILGLNRQAQVLLETK
jgi:hypothetical protein